jgi:spore coat protein CotH
MIFAIRHFLRQVVVMLNHLFRFPSSFLARIGVSLIGCIVIVSSLSAARALTFEELYDSSKLLDVRITLSDSDWNTIRVQSRSMAQALGEERRTGKAATPFSYVTGDVSINGVEFKSVGIRKKGFIGSLDDTRPSLKVKFNHTDSKTKVAGVTQLTLNNNKQDGALVSQTMAYALFNQAGLPASKSSYAKVMINGQSLGIYTNVESARKPLVQRGFGTDKGTLFEGTIVDFFDGWAGGFEHKFGPEKKGRKKLQSVIDALNGPDGALVASLGKVIDLDGFLKFWAIESLIGFWDGYSGNQNNFFVYHNPKTDRLHFLPWGADSVFTSRGMFQRGGPQSVKARGRLASRLYQVPEIRERYRTVMLGILKSHWDEKALLAESERVEDLVGDSIHERQKGFSQAMDRTREFFSTRRDQITKELEDGTPEVEGGASEPMYFAKIGRVEGTINAQWFSDAPDDPTEVGEAKVKVIIDGKEVEFTNLGAHAVMGRRGYRGPGQPNINIVGERKSDGELVTLSLMLPEALFTPSEGKMVPVGGMMRQGQGFGFGPGGMSPIDGKIQVLEAALEDGAPVKVEVSAHIMKMENSIFGRGGGGPPRRGGPGGPPRGREGRPGRPQ